ncbi:MGMT family protein [Rosenbergiella nectarea subsp. apis]|nr:MGMT family protein [Rosenbergiella nectarea subsp. apis]
MGVRNASLIAPTVVLLSITIESRYRLSTMCLPEPSFEQRVWLVINAIPRGNVASYGDVAHLAGHPRAARQVGRILKHLPNHSHLPWHRVISQQGKISLSGTRGVVQSDALRQEGIEVSEAGRIDMQKYRWRP